jgi:Abnormal spindle-like microcephaly-assoc'd, ASPM-SPD-2-Hydin
MGHLPARWNAFIILMALATLTGCQGFSSGKSNATQGTQTLPGALTAAPASVSFGNVQVGTSQVQSDTLSNTGSSSLTVTAATMSGAGFTTTGLNLPLTLDVGQSVSFSIVFGPQTAGSASVSLALTNSASSTPLSIALTGTGVAAGGLTGSPASFSFGNVQVGLSQSQTETLNNTSSQSFTLSQATFSGSGFSTSGLSLPLTLGPNQSTSFAVAFTPATVGAANGTLSLAVSGSSTTLDFALSGVGVAPATLSATPASLTFTSVQVGQTQSQTETVRNTGGTNSTISQATVAGSGFSISGLATPLTLTPGQSASFSVTFAPQSAGSVSGSVMVDSDATNPALSVALSGTAATQSQGTLSATAVNAGSVVVGNTGTQTGTLSATGASVSVTSVSLSGANPSEFSISGITFPVTVTTTQPVTFTVNFTPGSSGAASATASFASTAANTPNAASLTGTGTAAPIHSVNLSWKASTTSGLTSYNVYRAVFTASACGSYSTVGSTASSVTTFTDNLVTDGTTYCYATTAVDAEGESGYSNIVEAVIPSL